MANPFVPFIGNEDALDCADEGPDGYTDGVLRFDNQAIGGAVGSVRPGDVLVPELTGEPFDGTPVVGADVVVVAN